MKTLSVLLHSPLALATTEGPMHTLLDVNPAFCALQGKKAEEIVGHHISEFVSGAGADALLALLDRVYSGGKSGSVNNLNYSDADNSLVYRSYVAWSLPVMEGHTGDLVIQVTDLTDETHENKRIQRRTSEIIELNHEVRQINEQLVISGLSLQSLSDRNRAIADALQNSILWQEPERVFGNLKVSALYESGNDEAIVGGDLFDVVPLLNGPIMLAVGDVTGKGLKAIARIAEIIFAVRAFAHEHEGPADVMTRLNDLICNYHQDDDGDTAKKLIALSLVVVDPLTGVCQAASAGAEPPLVLRASGAVEELDVRGLLLGVQPHIHYETTEFELGIGDFLLMTTDGITETRCGLDFFGSDRVLAAARKAASTASLHEVGTAIVESARHFGGGRFGDDVCLLLARRDPAD